MKINKLQFKLLAELMIEHALNGLPKTVIYNGKAVANYNYWSIYNLETHKLHKHD